MPTTVARVKQLSSKDIKECIRNSTPMIATDMLKSWKASTRWSFEFLKQRYGADMVTLSDGRFRSLAQLPLAHCIDLFQAMDLGDTYKYSGATPYIQDWVVLDIHPELYGDIEVPEWFENWERPFKKTFLPSAPYHDIVALGRPARRDHVYPQGQAPHPCLAGAGRRAEALDDLPARSVSARAQRRLRARRAPVRQHLGPGPGELSPVQGRHTH